MRNNKFRIPFVQGKYNMGGTGALNFCSEKHRLQLVVSRRDPELLPVGASSRDHEWGFTIVRRQKGEAGARSSVYTFLAPVTVPNNAQKGVLSFAAPEWPIFPEDPTTADNGADAYVRSALHGSLIKLYEYEWQGVRSISCNPGVAYCEGSTSLLPELALPVRLFECRSYNGGVGSFSTNALGPRIPP